MRTSDDPSSQCIIGLLMRNRRADERTRTAYSCSLRVIIQVLVGPDPPMPKVVTVVAEVSVPEAVQHVLLERLN